MNTNELILDFKCESEFLVYLLNYRTELKQFLDNSVIETYNEKADRTMLAMMEFNQKEKIENELMSIEFQIVAMRNYLQNNRL